MQNDDVGHLISRNDCRFTPELDKRDGEREPERPDGSFICRSADVSRAGIGYRPVTPQLDRGIVPGTV